MADNYPGPYQIDIEYVVENLTHVQRLNCDVTTTPDPGTDITTLELNTRDAGVVNLETALLAWIDLLAPFYNDTVVFNVATLWRNTPLSLERTFIGSYVIDVNGTSSSPTVKAGQVIFTFRTLEGGVMRINLMEAINSTGKSVSRSSLGSGATPLAEFIESEDNWILGRDTSYPISGIAFHPGQNEYLFKKRYRTL